MSLDWSTQKVEYFKNNPDELWTKYRVGTPEEYEDLNAETKALVFGSMALGLGNITEANISDWYARWKMYEKYEDFYLYSSYDGEIVTRTYLTPEALIKHIGLSTNVSTETNAAWCKRFTKPMNNDKGNRPTFSQAKAMVIVFQMEYEDLVSQINKTKETV